MDGLNELQREVEALRERISRLAETEKRARADLEALEEFIGLVSHELRAPLSAVKGSTVALLDRSTQLDPKEADEYYRIIDNQTEYMRTLVSDLLDAGRIESGALSVSPSMESVSVLVEKARSMFLNSNVRHSVNIDLPRDLPPVMVEQRRIVQVLNNLLSNSARHAPQSSPIKLEARYEGAFVEISVTDESQGVEPERLAHLFRKYSHNKGRGVRAGLGLAICKGLVEAHGGRIRATSGDSGRGLRISFTLPAAISRAVAAEPIADGAESTTKEREKSLILVVDDDPHTLRFCRDALNTQGYDVIVTVDHNEMTELIRKEKPSLVLLDLVLPGTDGIALMEKVSELSDQPVVFISGYGRDETIARALDTGAADYIVKPFTPTELGARVRAALRRRARLEPFKLGKLVIDYELRQVTLVGENVELTNTEYELLQVLSTNFGRLVSFEKLLHRVWHNRTDDTRILRTFIKNLRQKLRQGEDDTIYIENVRGAGYRMPRPNPEASRLLDSLA